MSMRLYQQKYSKILRSTLEVQSTQGENTVYIITSVCIGIVFISVISLLPTFIWVIKDKSYVIRIFADIEEEEVKQLIKFAETCNIKLIKYKRKWIKECNGDEAVFWNKIMKDITKSKTNSEAGNIPAIQKAQVQNPLQSKNISMATVKESEKLIKGSIEETKKEEQEDAESEEGKKKEEKAMDNTFNMNAVQAEEQKKRKIGIKREVLGKLE